MIKYLSLFSGIGAFETALENLGIEFELTNYCEIEAAQSKAYSMLHGVNEDKNLWDITKVNENKLGKVDLITYGFPCQDLSVAGTQKGFFEDGEKTRSGLFFDAVRIINATQPKVAIAENVKTLLGKKFKSEFETCLDYLSLIGYNTYYTKLKATDFGIPQSRERAFLVSIRKDIDTHIFEFPKGFKLYATVNDFLEQPRVDPKYYISDRMFAYALDLDETQKGTAWEGRVNNNYINPPIAHTLSIRGIRNQRVGVTNFVSTHFQDRPITAKEYKTWLNGVRYNIDLRFLTQRECFRLMGFKDSQFDIIKDSFTPKQLDKFAGNSIVVPVLEALFTNIFDNEGNIHV